jgi:hypothetical protein
MVGDLDTVALVGKNGSIDWWLSSRFRLAERIRRAAGLPCAASWFNARSRGHVARGDRRFVLTIAPARKAPRTTQSAQPR